MWGNNRILIMEGIKESENKLEYELCWEFIEGMAKRMSLNKGKYPKWNWQKPIDIQSLKDALTRHFIEVMKENWDDEQDYGHLYAIAINAMLITYQLSEK